MPQILPDLQDQETIEEERAVNILRSILTSCPDVNELLQNNVVISTRGPLAMCLGMIDMATLFNAGFKA